MIFIVIIYDLKHYVLILSIKFEYKKKIEQECGDSKHRIIVVHAYVYIILLVTN